MNGTFDAALTSAAHGPPNSSREPSTASPLSAQQQQKQQQQQHFLQQLPPIPSTSSAFSFDHMQPAEREQSVSSQGHEPDGNGSAASSSQQKQKKYKRPASAVPRTSRACAECNKSKVRCDGQEGMVCSRCAKQGFPCTWTESMRGKIKNKKRRQSDASSNQDVSSAPAKVAKTKPRPQRQEPDHHSPNDAEVQPGDDNASILPPSLTQPVGSSWPARRQDLGVGPLYSEEQRRLSTLPLPGDAENPLHALAEASRAISARAGSSNGKDDSRGVASACYFLPNEKETPFLTEESAKLTRGTVEAPHVLRHISPEDADLLFQTYREHLHMHLPCLAPSFITPAYVARRSNFLFNAICCVSARFCTQKPELAAKLQRFGRLEMSRFPLDKCIEVVQAHLLYAEWSLLSTERFENDSTWLRIGIAMRTALDLNLHRIALLPNNGMTSAEARDSCIRTWLLVYTLDQTLSVQLGKPINTVGDIWAKRNVEIAGNSPDDRRVVALVEYAQLLTSAMSVLSTGSTSDSYPLSERLGFPDIRAAYDQEFQVWADEAISKLASLPMSAHESAFTRSQILIHAHYGKLIVNSNLLQRKLDQHARDLAVAFTKFQSSAFQLLEVFETIVVPSGLLKYFPEFLSTYLAYGCVCLLKSTQPQFRAVCANTREVFAYVDKIATMMADYAARPDHLPYMHSRFIKRLLANRQSSRQASPALEGATTLDGRTTQSTQQASGAQRLAGQRQAGAGDLNGLELLHAASTNGASPGSQTVPLESYPSTALDLTVGNFAASAIQSQPANVDYFASDSFWNSIFQGGDPMMNSTNGGAGEWTDLDFQSIAQILGS